MEISREVSEEQVNKSLDDIDPIALVHNPWWKDRLRNGEHIRTQHDSAVLFIRFDLCGFCMKKLKK